MHPRLLKTFLAVARSRNITRAAEEVHLAQSSVSDQLQSLEAELNADLFVRSKRGMEPTRAGETLRPYANKSCRWPTTREPPWRRPRLAPARC